MINLLGREALKVRALPGVFPYAEDSKMKGEKYRRFVVNGKAFIAQSTDAFCTAFDSGLIYSVDLDSNEEGQLSLANFTTIAQEVNMAKTSQLLRSFENTVLVPAVLTDEVIDALK